MKHDVIIAGAGLAGLTLALALAAQQRRVLVLDARAAAPVPPATNEFDQRIYAISPASVAWLQSIRVWQNVDAARVTPVYDMRIHGDAPQALPGLNLLNGLPWFPGVAAGADAGGLHLSAYRAGVGELCHIVEERELARAVEGAVRYAAGIEIMRPVEMEALVHDDAGVRLTLADGRVLEAELLVGADGAQSWVRAASGISVAETPYGQTAVVANFQTSMQHFNCATQWFRTEADGGMSVLAWLPLPNQQISMVWSAPDALAAELAALAPDDLAARVMAAGDGRLGELRPAGACATFPLRNLRAKSLIASRVALVGDAAHVVHPLAGQGLNLGFGDCAALAEVLAGGGRAAPGGAHDPGDVYVLRRYDRARAAAVLEMHAVTHGLQRLFSSTHPLLRTARNIGLNLTGQIPVLAQWLVQRATRTFQ